MTVRGGIGSVAADVETFIALANSVVVSLESARSAGQEVRAQALSMELDGHARVVAALVGRLNDVVDQARALVRAGELLGARVSDTGAPASTAPPTLVLLLPQGMSADQMRLASSVLREATAHLGGQVVVQGSRAAHTARPDSDIDIAVLVDGTRFDELIESRFARPNPGSARERTRQHAIRTGKIQAGEAGLGSVRRRLQASLGIEVDLSVVRRGGPFDTPPFIAIF